MRGSLHPGSNVFLLLWVCACWAIARLSTFIQWLHLFTSLEMKKTYLCYYFVLKLSVLLLMLQWCPGKTVTSAWVGKVVATERSINFSSRPRCPTCVTLMYKRGDISVKILISTPWLQSVQPTNVAPLSRMCIWYNDYDYYYYYCYYYLRNILERVIVKGRKGLNSYHHNTILWPFPLKPYVGFLYRIMFWVFVAVCGTPFCAVFIFYFLFLYYVFVNTQRRGSWVLNMLA